MEEKGREREISMVFDFIDTIDLVNRAQVNEIKRDVFLDFFAFLGSGPGGNRRG